jgi:hypothetical protein
LFQLKPGRKDEASSGGRCGFKRDNPVRVVSDADHVWGDKIVADMIVDLIDVAVTCGEPWAAQSI